MYIVSLWTHCHCVNIALPATTVYSAIESAAFYFPKCLSLYIYLTLTA